MYINMFSHFLIFFKFYMELHLLAMQWKLFPMYTAFTLLCIKYEQEHFHTILTLFMFSDYLFLSENLTTDHSCSYDMQCTGTECVCNNCQCECQTGYILNGTKCYQGNWRSSFGTSNIQLTRKSNNINRQFFHFVGILFSSSFNHLIDLSGTSVSDLSLCFFIIIYGY